MVAFSNVKFGCADSKKVKMKVNFTLEQTTKVQRRSRGTALLFL